MKGNDSVTCKLNDYLIGEVGVCFRNPTVNGPYMLYALLVISDRLGTSPNAQISFLLSFLLCPE